MSLYIAAQNGDVAAVKHLVQLGADVNQATSDGAFTPLLIAADKGHLGVVIVLVDNGANVNQADKCGFVPLSIAAFEGHLDMVQYLVNQGADVNHARENGATPLFIAALKGHLDVVTVLVDNGANVDQARKGEATPLLAAALNGHLGVVQCLISKGVDVNQTRTEVLAAAQEGHLDVVTVLVENGATVDQARKDGFTPLLKAAQRGHVGVARYLVGQAGLKAAKGQLKKIGIMPGIDKKHLTQAVIVFLSLGVKLNDLSKKFKENIGPFLTELVIRLGQYPLFHAKNGLMPEEHQYIASSITNASSLLGSLPPREGMNIFHAARITDIMEALFPVNAQLNHRNTRGRLNHAGFIKGYMLARDITRDELFSGVSKDILQYLVDPSSPSCRIDLAFFFMWFKSAGFPLHKSVEPVEESSEGHANKRLKPGGC